GCRRSSPASRPASRPPRNMEPAHDGDSAHLDSARTLRAPIATATSRMSRPQPTHPPAASNGSALHFPQLPPAASARSPVEGRLLPSVALQGAVGTLGGFLGFFVVGSANLAGMIRFTATMLTVAMLSVVLAYALGPRLRLTGRRLFKTGFILPGLLLLLAGG